MTERDALLAAILSSPEDDTPRMIYADWLEERGEVERADFVRVQCELARTPPLNIICRGCGKDIIVDERVCDGCVCNSPAGVNHGLVPQWVCLCSVCDPEQTGSARWSPLRRRERELLEAKEWEWLHAIHPELQRGSHDASTGRTWWLRKPAWSRGLLKSVEIDWETFREIHAALIWSPRQTTECPKCIRGMCNDMDIGDITFAEWPCENCGGLSKDDRGLPANVPGTGRIPRPFVPTAQPIETVRLTTWPVNIRNENQVWIAEYRFDRVKCGACNGNGTERYCDAAGDMDDRECSACHGRPLNLWRCDAWPDQVFVMPGGGQA